MEFNAMNKHKDSRNISNEQIKDSSSRPSMCGTLMLWIGMDKMKQKQQKLSGFSEKKYLD